MEYQLLIHSYCDPSGKHSGTVEPFREPFGDPWNLSDGDRQADKNVRRKRKRKRKTESGSIDLVGPPQDK